MPQRRYELQVGVPGGRGAACLIFHREAEWHRPWDYPADWIGLLESDLAELSRRK